jgi:hypothetical protein
MLAVERNVIVAALAVAAGAFAEVPPSAAALPKDGSDLSFVVASMHPGGSTSNSSKHSYRFAPGIPAAALASERIAQSRPSPELPRQMQANVSHRPSDRSMWASFSGWFDVQIESRLSATILFLLGAAVWSLVVGGHGRVMQPAAPARPSTN